MAESTSSIDLLKLYEEKILPVGISGKGKTDEIIDIISGYPWSAQQFDQRNTESNKMTYSHNIPFCYAIERQQTVGSGAANIINTLLGSTQAFTGAAAIAMRQGGAALFGYASNIASAGQSANNANSQGQGQGQTQTQGETGKTPAQQGQSEAPQNSSSSMASDAAQMFKNWMSSTESLLQALRSMGDDISAKISPRLLESNLAGSDFLSPWKWLYLTKATTKKYVFPCFSANDLLKVTNAWGNGGTMGGKIGGMFDSVIGWIEKGSEFMKGIKDFLDFLPQENQSFSYENFEIEKALGYNYAGNGGQTFKSEFVLYNTTKKDAWKKNYRFLLLFLLRNIPFRTTIYSYKTPLLYDIIVPGLKHLPLCYVQNINISSLGHVRNMKCENILKEIVESATSTESVVPVPEAWRVEIDFKCLIPDTSNLMLNLTAFPINVTTVTK